MQLPNEIIDIIYKQLHSIKLNNCHNELKYKTIFINKHYIISRKNEHKKLIEQYVKVDGFNRLNINGSGPIIYRYFYGISGLHEGFALKENIRELNDEEIDFKLNNLWWKLPNDFCRSNRIF